MLTKSNLTDELATRADLSAAEAKRAVDALFSTDGIIARALARDEKLQITGFGTFEARLRKSRKSRNPQTGEIIEIPAAVYPAFRAGSALKESVRGGPHGTGPGA